MNLYLWLAVPVVLFPLVILLDFRKRIGTGFIYIGAFLLLLGLFAWIVHLTEKNIYWVLLPAVFPLALLLARWVIQKRKN